MQKINNMIKMVTFENKFLKFHLDSIHKPTLNKTDDVPINRAVRQTISRRDPLI